MATVCLALQSQQSARAITRASSFVSRTHVHRISRRTFLNNLFNSGGANLPFNSTGPEIITETRTLPYSSSDLFAVISDIDSYHTFIPYCTRSQVLSRTAHPSPSPPPSGSPTPPRSNDHLSQPSPVETPSAATLVISWNQLEESFTSRIRCQPGRAIEACSGTAQFTLPASSSQPSSAPGSDPDADDGRSLFTHLLTRWTLTSYPYKPPQPQVQRSVSSIGPPQASMSSPSDTGPSSQSVPTDGTDPDAQSASDPTLNDADGRGYVTRSVGEVRMRTDVVLRIEYRFRSPVYNALSRVAAPKVAGRIIEAFEKRAAELAQGRRS